MKKYWFLYLIFCSFSTICIGQNERSVIELLRTGKQLKFDWVQQQYLVGSSAVKKNYPLFPDQLNNEEGEMHATLRLEIKDSFQLLIWVESIYSLYFHKKYTEPFNPNVLIPSTTPNSLVYPEIDDTRFFYEKGAAIPHFLKNLTHTPIQLDLRKGILNKKWFDAIEGRDKYTGVYFNYYFVEQMIKALLPTIWTKQEHYQLIEQEKGNYQHTVHFVRPNLPPQKTIIRGVVENFYEQEVSFSYFNEESMLKYFSSRSDITLDTNGQFKFEVDLDKPVCLKLAHDYNQVRVYAEPGDSIFVRLDGNAFYRKTRFSGDNALANQVLLDLYHELREDTYERPSAHEVLKQTQLAYLAQLEQQKKQELHFLQTKKEKLSASFYQFLERHIRFHYARSLLNRIVYFYTYKDAFIEPSYLEACRKTRKLLFRLPDGLANTWVLHDYLKVGRSLLKGPYSSQGPSATSLAAFDLGKFIYTEPENQFRLGELLLFLNSRYNEDKSYIDLLTTLKKGCNLSSYKKRLDTYLKILPDEVPENYFVYFPLNTSTPRWTFSLSPTKKVDLTDYIGEYLLLHIGLGKNLRAAQSDILAINKSMKHPIKTLSIVTSRDTNLIGDFSDNILYISPAEMKSLRDSFYIKNNANYFYVIDPKGKVITSPYNVNSYKKLASTVTNLPINKVGDYWQPTPVFWRNSGILALGLLFLSGIYIQRKSVLSKREQQRRQLLELELKGIRAQMNPHFLFNALSSIQNLIRKKEEVKADRYLTQFAGLVRKILRNSEQEFITLEEEVAAIRQYCSLEALRTPFDYKINIAEDIDAFSTYIPSMLLQPIIENAILHGLMPKQGLKHLRINIEPNTEGLACEVIDNGIGIHQAKLQKQSHKAHQKNFGIALIKQRLALLRKKDPTELISIQDRSDTNPAQTGTIVKLLIPVEA